MNTQRLDELAAAWSSGDQDPVHHQELETLLRDDPAARRRFVDHCVAEVALIKTLTAGAAAVTSSALRHPSSRRLRPVQRTRRQRLPAMGWWAAGVSAAAAALVIAVLTQSPTTVDGPRVAAGSVVAHGRVIAPGGRLGLPVTNARSGDDGLELSAHAGIRLQTQPDTRFTITAPGALDLDSGEVVLDVERGRAPLTTVRTAELLTEVLGTRFSVQRRDGISELAVERGRVRVTARDGAMRDLTAGMRIAADHRGFIIEEPAPARPATPSGTAPVSIAITGLILLDASNGNGQRLPLDQPIRLRADQDFTLRTDVAPGVAALRYRLAGDVVRVWRPLGLEIIPPFYLWGDRDGNHSLQRLARGTHHLDITAYADERGMQVLASQRLTIIVE